MKCTKCGEQANFLNYTKSDTSLCWMCYIEESVKPSEAVAFTNYFNTYIQEMKGKISEIDIQEMKEKVSEIAKKKTVDELLFENDNLKEAVQILIGSAIDNSDYEALSKWEMFRKSGN